MTSASLVALPGKPEEPLVIWGPISVEAPSADGKLVALRAIERAYPQLLKRGRLSVMHRDQLVGDIVAPIHPVDSARLPESQAVREAVLEAVEKYGGLPTAPDVEITPKIAAAFPRLKPLVGEKVPFIAGSLYGDNRTALQARQDIMEGKLDSFSISAMTFGTKLIPFCDPRGCRIVEEIDDLDLSAVTIGASNPTPGVFSKFKTMNHGAQFLVVQQAHAPRLEPLTEAGDNVSMGGCGAQAIIHFLQAQEASLRNALASPGRAAVLDTLQQAEEGWLGSEAQRFAAELGRVVAGDEGLKGLIQSAMTPMLTGGNRHGQAESASSLTLSTMPQATAEAKPAEQAAPAASKTVQQADQVVASPGTAEALVEQSRRIEALEQSLAELKGRIPTGAPAAQADADKKDDAEKEKEGKKVEEAKQMEQAVLGILAKHGVTLPKAQPAAAVEQAKPTEPGKVLVQAETPDPTPPQPPGADSKRILEELSQAIDAGDPSAPRDFIEQLRARRGT